MQMGVLRLGIVGIQVRQTHVGNLAPLAGLGLDIAVVHVVERVLLDGIEEPEGERQCLVPLVGRHRGGA